MRKLAFVPVFILVLLSVPSCSYDNLDDYYSDAVCDTLDVTFSDDVYPIIDRNCLGCHYAGNSIGIELETYSDIVALAGQGRLQGAIKHLPGYEPMPRGGDKLDDCSIAKIDIWINQGSPQN